MRVEQFCIVNTATQLGASVAHEELASCGCVLSTVIPDEQRSFAHVVIWQLDNQLGHTQGPFQRHVCDQKSGKFYFLMATVPGENMLSTIF